MATDQYHNWHAHEDSTISDRDSDEIRLYTPTSSITCKTDSEDEPALSEDDQSDLEDSPPHQPQEDKPHHHDNSFHKRQITINHGETPIHGTYPLFDLLSLSTTTGDIHVVIIPQQASPFGRDRPARLQISSAGGGDVRVDFRAAAGSGIPPPPRSYNADIQTTTGSITGTIPFSANVRLATATGAINTVLVPLVTERVLPRFPSITSLSRTGCQLIFVAEPVAVLPLEHGQDAGVEIAAPMGRGNHISSGGSLHIKYPRAWAGRVNLSACTGCMVGGRLVRASPGEGVKKWDIQRDGKERWWGSKEMEVSLETRGAAMFTVG